MSSKPRSAGLGTLFTADTHLGRLARDLRMLGFDTLWSGNVDDVTLLDQLRTQERHLLTRDHALFERAGNPALPADWSQAHFVSAPDPDAQLLETLRAFSLLDVARRLSGFLTRCLDCNTPILQVGRDAARERVPREISEHHTEFFLCPRCERLYWKGSHTDRMRNRLSALLG